MFRTDPQHLAWVMDNLVEGHVVNKIVVDKDDARLAKKALDNMLAIH
jgi:quinolinate synthase